MSLPIGVQWEVLQGKHLGINAEASVQPTLTLNTNTYLLSTDYKHYTTGNDLIRKWNINTSMGFNISYKSGSLLIHGRATGTLPALTYLFQSLPY